MKNQRIILSSNRTVDTIEYENYFFVKCGDSYHGTYPTDDNRFSQPLTK